MKRAAYLLGALLAASTVFVSAAPLPEPLFHDSVAAASSGTEFPVPEFAYPFSSFASLTDLWSSDPSPAGVDFFDPSVQVADFWGVDPDPQEADAFAPIARLADLWSIAPVPAFDRSGGVVFESMDFAPVAAFAEETTAATDASKKEQVDEVVLRGLLNNQYYRDSIRLKKLAVDAFDYGDYDASKNYASDAAAAAKKSDEYVALRLKIRAVDEALAKAKARLDWATKIGAEKSYSGRFAAAKLAYEEAKKSARGRKLGLGA